MEDSSGPTEAKSNDRTIVSRKPYLRDVTNVSARLSHFQSEYVECTVTVDGNVWSYRRTGDTECPLVMLPGIQGGGDVFFEIGLTAGHALDILTISAPPIVDAVELVDAHAKFFDTLGIRRADIFGSSLGGYLAQLFVIRHPGRVGQIFLANTFIDPAPFLAKIPSTVDFASMPAKAVVETNLKPMLDVHADDQGQQALQAVLRALVGPVQSVDAYKARLMTLLGAVAIDRIPVPDHSVILIDDDADPNILPEMRAAVRGRYESSCHYLIEGGGHLPAIQRPDAVVAAILDRLG